MDDTTAVRGGRNLITAALADATPGLQGGQGVPDPSGLPWHTSSNFYGTNLAIPGSGPSGLLNRVINGDTADPRRPTFTGAPAELVFQSNTINVEPIIQTTVYTDPNGSVPSVIDARLTWNNGTPQDWVAFSTTGHSAGDTYDLALQCTTPVTATGAYPYEVEVTIFLPGGDQVNRDYRGTAYEVVQGSGDAFGPGWSVSGLDQLVTVTGGQLWVYGSGGWRFFQSLGSGAFLSPAQDPGTLVQNGDNSFTYTAKDQTQWNFSSNGQLGSVVDPHGLALTYTYSSGQLSGMLGPDGSSTTFNYTSGLLSSIQEPGSRTVTVTHNGAGDLSSITNPDGGLRSFTYDGLHHLTNDRWGLLSATMTYNATTSLVNAVDWGGGSALGVTPASSQGLATNPAINLSQAVGVLTDGLSQAATYTMDGLDRLVQLKTPDGAAQVWQRDFSGQVTAYTDSQNRTTTLGYLYGAADGDLTQVTNPDGSSYPFAYDTTFHHVSQITDTRGNTTALGYNSSTGDLLTVQDANGKVTTFTWTNGLEHTVTDRRGNITTSDWDTANRRVSDVVDAQGDRTSYTYRSSAATKGSLLRGAPCALVRGLSVQGHPQRPRRRAACQAVAGIRAGFCEEGRGRGNQRPQVPPPPLPPPPPSLSLFRVALAGCEAWSRSPASACEVVYGLAA